MSYAIVTKNKKFENLIFNFFKKNNEDLLVVNSISKLYSYYFRNLITTVIVDQDYIKLNSTNLFFFTKSYRLEIVFLTINSKNLLFNKVDKIKEKNIELLKRQNIYNDKVGKLFISFLDYIATSYDSINKMAFRKRERELLLFMCNQSENTASIELIIHHLWEDSDQIEINKHKKTIYSYISRINTLYKKSSIIDLRIIRNHKKYYLECF